MSKKIILSGVAFLVSLATIEAKEPVIMTVAGEDVPKSEFKYLYDKNNQQQLNPQTLDEYVEMFKIYKMKVADAKSLGIDTTASFRKEIAQYRRDLASQYMADSTFINQMIENSYNHSKEEVGVSFIRLPKSRNPQENKDVKILADSIVTAIRGGANFGDLAKKYSKDTAAEKGGEHGYMTYGRLPYLFEEALYSTSEGQVSNPVELQDGYYIILAGKRQPSRGRVEGAHILKLVSPRATKEEEMKIMADMDSIYNVLISNPEKFSEIAMTYSDDKGSAANGGRLPLFGVGEMVPELEQVSFNLTDGEISKPFKTRFGYHIVKKYSTQPSPSREEVKKAILQSLNSPMSDRYSVVKEREMDALIAKHKGQVDKKGINKMKDQALAAGIDSLYLANWTTMPNSLTPVAKIGKKKITAGQILQNFNGTQIIPSENSGEVLDRAVKSAMLTEALQAEEDNLYKTQPEYRNLLDEYTDGSLLYEVSLIKVWDKGSKDKAGLEEYFNNHKDDFKWEKPHAKGILVQTLNDSISGIIKDRLVEAKGDQQKLNNIRKEFTGKATIETFVVEEGQNPMVDFVMFGGQPAKPRLVNFTDFFLFEPRIITEPEEVADVRGEAISAYQNELEKEWIEELQATYPAIVNKKEIDKLR